MIRWGLKTDLHVVGHHAGVHGSSAGSKSSAEFVSEGVKAKQNMSKNKFTLHNVLFVQYVFLPTEQTETYFKICILTYDLTYICPGLFDWKENTFF